MVVKLGGRGPGHKSRTPPGTTTAALTLSGLSTPETSSAGALIGTLGTVGTTGTPVYALDNNAGGKAAISGANINRGATALSFETAAFFDITVSVTGVTPTISPTTFRIAVTTTAIDPARFGMPTAATTGVRDGVTLTPYVGGTTITAPNTVIEGKTFEETLHIHAANVTVRDCFFENWSFFGIDADDPAVTGLLVEYCTFVPGPFQTNSAILGCGILRFNDISQSENGISVTGTDTSTITDNFIHDLQGRVDAHIDGIAIQGGQDGVLVEHNTVESWDTSCIFIQDFFAAINNVTVRNNLLYNDSARGLTAAAIYVEGRFGNGTTNVLIENNYIMAGVAGFYSIDTASPVIRNNIEWHAGTDPTPYP